MVQSLLVIIVLLGTIVCLQAAAGGKESYPVNPNFISSRSYVGFCFPNRDHVVGMLIAELNPVDRKRFSVKRNYTCISYLLV
jgi:hypothetical protein